MQDHFKQFFALCSSEMIFSFLIEILMLKAIEIEIAFFSWVTLNIFKVINENSTSAFNHWDNFRTFTSKLFSNLKVPWDRFVFVWKEKISTIFKINSIDFTWISNLLGVYANNGGNAVRQQHQTLKAVTDGKLLTIESKHWVHPGEIVSLHDVTGITCAM